MLWGVLSFSRNVSFWSRNPHFQGREYIPEGKVTKWNVFGDEFGILLSLTHRLLIFISTSKRCKELNKDSWEVILIYLLSFLGFHSALTLNALESTLFYYLSTAKYTAHNVSLLCCTENAQYVKAVSWSDSAFFRFRLGREWSLVSQVWEIIRLPCLNSSSFMFSIIQKWARCSACKVFASSNSS